MSTQRIVALEEHLMFPNLTAELPPELVAQRGFADGGGPDRMKAQLAEVGAARVAAMDAAGISQQVLSMAGPGADLLPPDAAPAFARRYNDSIAAVVIGKPGRFAAFAHLPMTDPLAAADELERCVRELRFCGAMVNGHTGGLFLDDPSFEPILARAEALDVPIYIHPGIPPAAVRAAYYGGFDPLVNAAFAAGGWGWHAETAVHVLRLVLAGALDRHPKLQIIIGHMGEGLPAMLARCDGTLGKVAKLERAISQTILEQVTITTSGFFTLAPFMAALLTFGADRILFSVDYPFSGNDAGRAFLDALPVSPSDREKIAHVNADRLLKLM